jgi:predicted flap endonuclease-1-like 5' DNA nuclease
LFAKRKIKQRDEYIQELEDSVESRDIKIQDLNEHQREQGEKLESMISELGKQKEMISNLEYEVKDSYDLVKTLKEERIDLNDRARQTISERNDMIQELDNALKVRDMDIKRMKRRLQEKDVALENLNKEIGQRDKTIDELGNQLTDRNEHVNALKEDLSKLHSQLREFEGAMRIKEHQITSLKTKALAMQDDFTYLNGIGPKVSTILRSAGVKTFKKLATIKEDKIREILETENPNLLRLTDPATWSDQARMVAEGEWEALKALQDDLKENRRQERIVLRQSSEMENPAIVSETS